MKTILPSSSSATAARQSSVGAVLMLVYISLTVATVNGQSLLLKDINTSEDIQSNEFRALTRGYNKVYFINNFNELWKTTGNVAGTVRLKQFSRIEKLTHIGQTLYFAADDGTGMELWKSTGTYASTVKVKDFVPGTSGGNPDHITDGNGVIYFTASTPGEGTELWRTDGTSAGTSIVKDIQPGRRGSDPRNLTFMNGALYFSANDGKNGHEVWKSDGTPQGTVMLKDVRTGQYLGSTPDQLTNVNGTLYFVAYESTAGRELWKSDGTTEGTVLAANIRPGSGSPGINNLTAVNSTLFFSANDGIHGHELWKSDGSQTVLVKDLTPGGSGSHGQEVFTHPMTNFTSVFGLLYFTAYENDTYYIWKSDGTESGTVPIEMAFNGIYHPEPRFVAMGSSIYYFNSADDDVGYYETHLRKMRADGTGAVLIARLQQEDFYSRYNPELVTLNNSLYFWGRNDNQGFKLFRSNGTPGSMILLNDSYKPTVGSFPSAMTKLGNQVFFIAEEESYSPSLWRTDGTPAGTTKLKDLELYSSTAMAATDQHLFFAGQYSLQIWKTDGSPEGTVQVIDDPNHLSAKNLVAVRNLVYFDVHYGGLWRTDGTEGGTFALTDAASVRFMQPVGDLLLFMIERENNQFELWRTNGEPSGTFQIYTFGGTRYSIYEPRAADDNSMYFVADDGITGNEVWHTDGTTSGTFRIADLNANDDNFQGTYEMDIANLALWRDELYISALDNADTWALYKYDGSDVTRMRDMNIVAEMIPTDTKLHIFAKVTNDSYNNNHWVTDGTTDGTELINEMTYYDAIDYTIYDGVMYFNAYDQFLWRSDGTACGTFPIDLGVQASNVLERIGNLLVFSGSTVLLGSEPFVFDLSDAPPSSCGEPTATVAPAQTFLEESASVEFTSYPNPFTGEFVVLIPGSRSDQIEMQIFTASGHPVETIKDIPANTEYRLGGTWKPGNYLVQIKRSGEVTTQQVIKK